MRLCDNWKKPCEVTHMIRSLMAASSVLVLLVTELYAQPIGVHSDNPHYFLFHGKPTVLITSAEHYGAVVDRAFDYRAYLVCPHSTIHSHSPGIPHPFLIHLARGSAIATPQWRCSATA